ncbi:hypothetical protein R6G85_02525 [Actinotignum urinale]|uniref:hypothetical protein n=1 Tax=Actinotignum urinale TaxID=190146 RepID=UPI002A7F226C|nr:hypothetical protein [Actinotignum urinale]MDY5151363.1 hypothetical protein [Actinotignum urinale]
MFDISKTIEPHSDQQNYDDYVAGSKIVTIHAVTAGTAEQPVNIELEEFPGRPYKPSKSMRRVLVAGWGTDAGVYAGRKLELAGNPDIKYAGVAVGGIEITGMSHIKAPLKLALTVSRGKKRQHIVKPLVVQTEPPVSDTQISNAQTVDELRALWGKASNSQKELISARVQQLNEGEN